MRTLVVTSSCLEVSCLKSRSTSVPCFVPVNYPLGNHHYRLLKVINHSKTWQTHLSHNFNFSEKELKRQQEEEEERNKPDHLKKVMLSVNYSFTIYYSFEGHKTNSSELCKDMVNAVNILWKCHLFIPEYSGTSII